MLPIALVSLAFLQSPEVDQQDVPVPTALNLASIVEHVVPSDDELKWRAIAWRPTLFDGLRDGVKEQKPVLLWTMNGHPLGAT